MTAGVGRKFGALDQRMSWSEGRPSQGVTLGGPQWPLENVPEVTAAIRVLDLYPTMGNWKRRLTSHFDPGSVRRGNGLAMWSGRRAERVVKPSVAKREKVDMDDGKSTAAATVTRPDMSVFDDYLKPVYKDGDVTLDVECGKNRGVLYLSKLCQGSKGPCILYNDMWLTPNEFQYVSGRETAKDWKRSIRHHGKSMKLLLSKGILAVHPPICDCDGCRISSPVWRTSQNCRKNRGRLAEKRSSLPEECIVSNGAFQPEVTSQGPLIARDIPVDPPAITQIMDSSKKKCEQTCTHNSQETEKKRESRLTSIIDQLISNKSKELHCNKEENNKSNHENNNEHESSGSDEHCENDLTRIKSSVPSSTNSLSPGSKDRTLKWIKSVSNPAVLNNGNGSEQNQTQGSSKHPGTASSSPAGIIRSAASVPLPSPPVHPHRGSSRKKCNRSGREEERKKEAKDVCREHACVQGSAPSPPPNHRSTALAPSPSAKVHHLHTAPPHFWQQPPPATPKSSSGARSSASRANSSTVFPTSMPADTLVVDPAKIKTERLSPPAIDSSSPSASPSSPAARSPTSSARLAGIAVSSPRAFSYNSPAFAGTPPPPPSPAPTSSTPGLDRFSPASLGSCTGTPILKQMEQMMTRNYSDFMRSLAAKYNNSNPAESYNYAQVNGFMRNFDGRFPLKTAATPPPSTGSGKDDAVNRKNDNHSAPPVLGDQRANMTTPLRVVDLSSTQALINMMRSASAHSASQLENYLRGTLKRPLGLEPEGKTHPLDLTVNSSKKVRTDGLPFDPAALSLRLHHGGRSIRDFQDLFGSLKSDSEGSDVSSDASPKSTNSRLWSSSALADPKRSPAPNESSSPGANKTSGSSEGAVQPHPCLSTCTERSCTDESEASVIAKWTVDDVCKFVTSIDTCAEYAETFREQSIDGAALPLLTEEHLINNMNMKLGPALKFRATLAKTIGHCAVCMHCIHCHGSGSATSSSGSTDRERRVTESA